LPFIFGATSTVLDRLLYHVYQKSISELLYKLLNTQPDTDFEEVSREEIKAKQVGIFEQLIERLGGGY
jgi:hypothetical protein